MDATAMVEEELAEWSSERDAAGPDRPPSRLDEIVDLTIWLDEGFAEVGVIERGTEPLCSSSFNLAPNEALHSANVVPSVATLGIRIV